jgi:hypothetical protein
MMSIDVSLRWHLSSNHFPPITDQWIEPAKRAIRNANAGEWTKRVRCPITLCSYTYGPGMTRYHRTAELISGLHLEPYLEFYLDDDEEEDYEPPEASLTTGWVDGRASYE